MNWRFTKCVSGICFQICLIRDVFIIHHSICFSWENMHQVPRWYRDPSHFTISSSRHWRPYILHIGSIPWPFVSDCYFSVLCLFCKSSYIYIYVYIYICKTIRWILHYTKNNCQWVIYLLFIDQFQLTLFLALGRYAYGTVLSVRFYCARVSKIYKHLSGERIIGEQCWDIPSRARNSDLCIFTHNWQCFINWTLNKLL